MIEPQTIAYNADKIFSILEIIIKNNEDNTPLIDYPVLIGSRAAKWHMTSFREPNDWQSTSFIDKVKSKAAFKDIKLIYYPGGGLKIINIIHPTHSN